MELTSEIKVNGRQKFSSNLTSFKLYTLLQDYLGTNLELIHTRYKSSEGLLTFETDQSTTIHKEFYQHCEKSEFLESYHSYAASVIKPYFQDIKYGDCGPLLIQRIPSFRVQVPNNIAVAEFHKDADYSHNVYETNIFLPFTDAIDTSTVWAETTAGSGDYKPLNTKLNELWIWDGANCLHGNKVNSTDMSRVSFDFRILPKKYYVEGNTKISVTAGKEMIIGDYWVEF